MAAAVFDQGVGVGPHLDQHIHDLKRWEGLGDLVSYLHWFDVIPIATDEVVHCMIKREDLISQVARFYMLIKQKFARAL